MRRAQDYLIIYLKGIAMGAADIVPGVSGGTIAIIAGIYQELINTIAGFNLNTLKIIKNQGIIAAWKSSNLSFLLSLLAGIVTSILTVSKLIIDWLQTSPLLVWAFFFGLVLASIWMLFKSIKTWSPIVIVAAVVGIIAGIWISLLPTPVGNSDLSLPYVFLCGMLAICAMILPGISGSFVLVLLGAYSFMLKSLHDHKIAIIITFILGAGIGILCFSRFVKWLLANYHSLTISILTGIMTGSLVKIWPWINPYTPMGFVSDYLFPVVLMFVGAILVLSLEILGKKRENR